MRCTTTTTWAPTTYVGAWAAKESMEDAARGDDSWACHETPCKASHDDRMRGYGTRGRTPEGVTSRHAQESCACLAPLCPKQGRSGAEGGVEKGPFILGHT